MVADTSRWQPQPAYSDRMVELYDHWFSNLDDDVDLYVEATVERGGRVLDAGCGTGRLLLPLLRAGLQADGLDTTPRMLERCQNKLAAEKLTATLHHGDLQTMSLPTNYRTIICAYNVFNFLLTQADQKAALLRLCQHLEPGGLLIMGVGGPETYRLHTSHGQIHRSYQPTNLAGEMVALVDVSYDHDVIEQTAEGWARLEVYHGGLLTEQYVEWRRRRWVYPNEMKLLMAEAGFAPEIEITDTWGDELSDLDAEMIYWAKRPELVTGKTERLIV